MTSASRTSETDIALIGSLQTAFAALADPLRAAKQQAYMKSVMPYYGIIAPDIRRLCGAEFKNHPLESAAAWEATALTLWRNATHREDRYAALELIGFKPYRRYFTASLVTTLEELIVSGPWWDYVDPIAINFVGHLLTHHSEQITPILRTWSTHENIWLRRSAILAQLKFKDRTDFTLLLELIEPSVDTREFFLRKAIGWVLREYSKTNAESVIDYVAANQARLSGLTRREALRILIKQGALAADDPRFS